MSTTTTLKIVGVPSATPQRGARWAAALFVAAWRGAERLLRTTPQPRTRAEEAAEVRALAMSVSHTDPGFAADLLAAADRHETTGA
jgi:hypothetical protein